MQIINNFQKVDSKKLTTFVYNHKHNNFFQSIKAYNFFKSVENYEPIFLVVREKDEILGSLLAVIVKEGKGIKGYFSRRCIIWGGPIVKSENSNVYSYLLKELEQVVAGKVIYTEFRNFYDLSDQKEIFIKNDYLFNEHLNFIVNIPSFAEAKAKLSKSKKRQINNSIKNGAKIIEANSLAQVKEFYSILKQLYKEKIKKPLPPFEFFENFFHNRDLGRYLLIQYNNKIIGGIMCPIYKSTIYEWFICGLDGKLENIYPSVLATWAPIEYAANNGLSYFDFMGAGKPDEDYGVREFKSKFGGELVNYGRYVKTNSPQLFKLGKFGIKVLGKFS